ncbi:MAG: fluoride efflux transporter CrcB [Pelagibacteraceae bacterium]|nr:fluoride efflux transporter CrcB [Pelagibacteraceae bacterium]MBT3902981.1 fluoride efflux transporter CrcB [Pelagibacteraceae bacterium]MBT4646346.1 fluoride efflux transporter CrcB [Pelagibacteraceae bacterium]MBT4950695.1 fluoride efflux transporter CrcB [Pelagibacteraceae bacterium]MBT5213382.1 fluoride efflux transporter CrcB [Pelagibacteraceae bacterium]
MINFLYVALGGSIGASLRFSFSLLFKNFLSLNYLFISTLLVNIIGSFLIGYTIFLLESKNITQDFLKYFIIIGILGSFTTFSTFSLENVEMLVDKKIIQAFLYMFFSLTLCLLFTYIGLNLNKIIN